MYFLRRAISLVSLEAAYTITCAPKGAGSTCVFSEFRRSAFLYHTCRPQVWTISLIYREGSPPVYSSDPTWTLAYHRHTPSFTIPNGDRGPHMDYIRSGDICTLHSDINFVHVYIARTGYTIEMIDGRAPDNWTFDTVDSLFVIFTNYIQL